MCLWINFEEEKNDTSLQEFLKDQKEIYVYKVLTKEENEEFYRSLCFPKFIWDFSKEKIYQVNRSSKPTDKELFCGRIETGFHVYTSFGAAKRESDCDSTIVKFQVKAENIIAVDCFSTNKLLCTELEFIEVLG
jgi:hypothetical protein